MGYHMLCTGHIVQGFEWWIGYTPLGVNVFITLAIQQQLEYRSKTLFEKPCIEP
jgi:hypothetical protein